MYKKEENVKGVPKIDASKFFRDIERYTFFR